jgi:two-component system, cell cycle response regulator DivK
MGEMNDRLVLIVEDDPDTREMLQSILQITLGVRSNLAEDGEVALQRIAEERPDLVLLDLRLPKRNGADVLRQIRADPAIRTIPVIVLTTGALPSDREVARAAGCDDYLDKPFHVAALEKKVRAHLGLGPSQDRGAGRHVA